MMRRLRNKFELSFFYETILDTIVIFLVEVLIMIGNYNLQNKREKLF